MTLPTRIARALVDGARIELELTPKPGLVDRFDNGSHPDLSFELMARSIDLLPEYFDDLLGLTGSSHLDLEVCIEAGRRAEARMAAEIGANAHRGYIFLAGLVLLAGALGGSESVARWHEEIGGLAVRVLDRQRGVDPPTPGARTRRALNVAGIHGEVVAGLPSVFERGLPALRRGLATLGTPDAAGHYTMAVLMQSVEDTTTLHRSGREGLDRVRRDGAALQRLIEAGGHYLPAITALNAEYRASNLTMGGVADCLALTFAVQRVLDRV